jgi:hypothetical protein
VLSYSRVTNYPNLERQKPVTMKHLLILLILLQSFSLCSISQDLPGPPANIQNLPKGSYVIPMDNTYQQNSNNLFNLKSYGLVVYLLNKNVKVKWVIKSGKTKDATDFTVTSDLKKPTTTATGLSRNFKAGPFVIFQTDTTGVAAKVDAYYALFSLAGSDRPNLYVTTANVNVDIRYDLTGYIPKGAVLTDGGNQNIHMGYMVSAGIPTSNYTTSDGENLTNCFTFASEPHNANHGALVDTAIVHIKSFVQLGGNFLAQCAADSNYENNPLGHFQSTGGMNVKNSNIGTGGSLAYPNPDLAYSQFEGDYFSYDGQSFVQNWQILGAPINSEHIHAGGTASYSTYYFATVSKLKGGVGGLVYYINCHDFNSGGSLSLLTTNGIRMYMNAFLTPSMFMCPLPLSIIRFSGTLNQGIPLLKWTVAENETGDHFELQKSNDGTRFSTVAAISVTDKEGLESYAYNDQKIFGSNTYYRLKMVNKTFTIAYSKIIVLKDVKAKNGGKLSILDNPVGSSLTFNYNASQTGIKTVDLYSTSGVKVYSAKVTVQTGVNSISLTLGNRVTKGIYIMEFSDNTEISTAKIIKL